nr:hypothetical protein [Microbacterium sp. cx-55]
MGASTFFAAVATHQATKEVLVNAVALIRTAPLGVDLLRSFERLTGNERLMAAVEDLTFVCDHPQVVRVSEDEAQLTQRDRSRLPLRGRAGDEALLGERITELREAVLAAAVLLEGPADERRTLGIHVDCVDESSVEVLAHIEVAELRATDRAAILRLVQHLVPDVLTALADLDLIHDVGDRFHGVGHVALTKLLLRGDELHAHTGKDALGDGSIGLVPKDARSHVDDDVAHLGMLLHVANKFAEDGALRDGLGRVAGFDKLGEDRRL